MTIISPSAEYTTLRKLETSPRQTVYLARGGGTVLLVRLTDTETVRGAGSYFESLAGNGIVIETFKSGRGFWIALEHKNAAGVRVSRAVRKLDLIERNTLARELIDGICAGNIPWPLLYDVLKDGNIAVGPDGKINFSFVPKIFPGYERDCRASCMSRLAALMRRVYGDTDNPCVDDFIGGLEQMRYSCMEELRVAFYRMYISVANTANTTNTALMVSGDPNFAGRILALLRTAAEYAGRLIAAALLILGYIALGRAVYDTLTNVPISGDIGTIGTVEIYESAE